MTQDYDMQKREADTPQGVERTGTTRVYTPAVDIYETKESTVLLADMPGVDKQSLDIELEKSVLTIRGKVPVEEPKKANPVYREYEVGNYERTFTLAETVDTHRIEATVKNGVLKLVLPKAEPEPARKITVNAS